MTDSLVLAQKRVKFWSPGREKQEESEGMKEMRGRDKRQYFSDQMSRDFEEPESDYAAAIAAAAFAVHSLEQEKMKRKALEASTIAVERSRSSSKPTRLFSNKEAKGGGDIVPFRSLSARNSTQSNPYPMQRATSRNRTKSKADSWEKDQMKKVYNRYEKTKSAILEWQNEKKMQAKLKMEKRKKLLEQKRTQNMQHYQNKIVRIEQIAGGARGQLEAKLRDEESSVKETAKKIRSRGNVHVKYFCFTCS